MNAAAGARSLWRRSTEVIREAQLPNGGYLAATAYPTYRYVWARDGSFIAEAARVAGLTESARRFHGFLARAILRVADGTPPGEALSLPARFAVGGGADRSEWPNFQTDGYGLWLWALGRYAAKEAPGGEVLAAAETAARYLADNWMRPCFDPWEEGGDTRPTATLLANLAGMRAAACILGDGPWRAAADLAQEDLTRLGIAGGVLTKDLGHPGEVDAATLWGVAPLTVVAPDGAVAGATLAAVAATLGAPEMHRHPRDTYYGGGVWPVLAALWGLGQLGQDRRADAEAALHWIETCADDLGDLPEQLPVALHASVQLGRWEKERGPVASPLTWSHAMYVMLAAALGRGADGDSREG